MTNQEDEWLNTFVLFITSSLRFNLLSLTPVYYCLFLWFDLFRFVSVCCGLFPVVTYFSINTDTVTVTDYTFVVGVTVFVITVFLLLMLFLTVVVVVVDDDDNMFFFLLLNLTLFYYCCWLCYYSTSTDQVLSVKFHFVGDGTHPFWHVHVITWSECVHMHGQVTESDLSAPPGHHVLFFSDRVHYFRDRVRWLFTHF